MLKTPWNKELPKKKKSGENFSKIGRLVAWQLSAVVLTRNAHTEFKKKNNLEAAKLKKRSISDLSL